MSGSGPRRIMPEREIKENMVLCLECYAGNAGAPFGVKLEDQVPVTSSGAELLSTDPYDAKLLSRPLGRGASTRER